MVSHTFAVFDEPALPRLATLGVVLSVHVTTAVWLLTAAPAAVRAVDPIRMDVSLIPRAAPSPPAPLVEHRPQTTSPVPVESAPVRVGKADPPSKPKPKPKPKPSPKASEKPAPAPLAEPQVTDSVAANDAGAEATQATVVPSPGPAVQAAERPSAGAPPALIEARFDADYLSNPAPVYPPVSRRRGEEGKVLLSVQVSAAGFAVHVEVRESSGYRRLDEAALHAVKAWRFVPARRGDQAIAASVVVPVVFRLDT